MRKVNFKYYRFPKSESGATKRFSILRPVIPIRLHGPRTSIDVWALVDSGADDCLFSTELADVLGIDWQSAAYEQYSGVDGSQFRVHFQNVTFEVGGHTLTSLAGFTEKTSYKAILGQHGFFDKTKVTFDFQKGNIEIVL